MNEEFYLPGYKSKQSDESQSQKIKFFIAISLITSNSMHLMSGFHSTSTVTKKKPYTLESATLIPLSKTTNFEISILSAHL
jgi:hypothetical protein